MTLDETDDTRVDEDVPGPSPRRTRRVTLAALAVVAIVVLATTAVLGWAWLRQRESERAAHEGLAAAQQFIGVLINVDGAKLDASLAAAADGATGEFKDQYAQSSAQLRQLLAENKASAHGSVVDAAVKSASSDRVVVLLFVDQSVLNTARLEPSRIRITMQKIDGRWLASKMELL